MIKEKIKSIIRFYHTFRNKLDDHLKNKHIGYIDALKNFYLNRNLQYRFINIEKAKEAKASDTIFILGSGPSLNNLNANHIEIINRHDSFGINYSFLKDEIIPTFYQSETGKTFWARSTFIKEFSRRRDAYKNSIFCLHDKELFRLSHPLLMPALFPKEPTILYYKLPISISLEINRSFCNEDFNKTLYYRGTLTLVLDIVIKLEYKKIVLIGIDPDKPEHFFDNLPEMQDYMDNLKKYMKDKKLTQYESMVPKGNKYNPIDIYLYSLKKYLSKERGIELYIAFKDNFLYPKIPAYF